MTSREARTLRRAEERKAEKLERRQSAQLASFRSLPLSRQTARKSTAPMRCTRQARRAQTTYDRAFHKALATLLKLQNRARKQAVPAHGFVSQQDSQPPATHAADTGFVSQKAANIAASAA